MQTDNPLLKVSSVCLAFGREDVVKDVSLELSNGEIGCLLGPSGCGKTTLYQIVSPAWTIPMKGE